MTCLDLVLVSLAIIQQVFTLLSYNVSDECKSILHTLQNTRCKK